MKPAVPPEPINWRRLAITFATFLVAYHLAMQFMIARRGDIPVYAPAGMAIGFLLLLPRREWKWFIPPVLLFALVYRTNPTPTPLERKLLITAVGATQAILGAWLVERFGLHRARFGRVRDVALFVAGTWVFIGVMAVVATFAYLELPWAERLVYLRTRWIGHAVAVLLFTPLLVTWAPLLADIRRWRLRPCLEALAIGALGLALATVSLGQYDRIGLAGPVRYLAMLPIVLAAVRFGQAGASLAVAFVSGYALWAVGEVAPAGNSWLSTELAATQMFLAVMSATGLLLGASIEEAAVANRAVRRNENRLRTLFDNTVNAVAVFQEGRVLTVNPAFRRLFGLAPEEEVTGREPAVFWDPALVARLAALTREPAPASGTLTGTAYRVSGGPFPAELRVTSFAMEERPSLMLSCRDLTGEQRTRREIERINRALRALSASNHALLHSKSEGAFLDEVVRVIAEVGGYPMVWVVFATSDPAKPVRIMAHAGAARTLIDELRTTIATIDPETMPTVRAIRHGEPVQIADIAADPTLARWREAALAANLRSCLAFPLRCGRQVIGGLSIYATEVGAFDRAEFDLLEELARDLSFGIQSHRERLEREQAEGEVRRLLSEADQTRLTLLSILEDRQRTEASRAETADRLALALRAARLGVWRYHLPSGGSEWDERMFAILGLPGGRLTPSISDLLSRVVESDRAVAAAALQPKPGGPQSISARFRIVDPQGATRHIEVQGLVRGDAGEPADWAIGVAGDVTELVEGAAESARLRAQLQQAQKMEALGTMAAGVAHDFNNLLTGINGFVELAATTLGPEHEANELLRRAQRGAMSARDLVRRILNFSRQSREQTRTLVNVADVVRETAPLIAATLPANISLGLELDGQPSPVVADGSQLQQILMNLCTNSAHAIGPAPGNIRVRVSPCLHEGSRDPLGRSQAFPSGPCVRVDVSDDGCGMDDETRRRLFEPFFTTKGRGEGTGLGMSIVQDIVTAHQGAVEVASTPGRGTTVTIHLPVAKVRRAAPVASVPPMAGSGQGQRVLVLDDEPSVLSVVQIVLQRNGYRTEPFTSPRAAWERFAADPGAFQLVLVDRNMPEMNGAEFIRRARGVNRDLPVVLMSGQFENESADEAGGDPSIIRLKKPFEIRELMTAVQDATRPAAPPSSTAAPALP